MAASALAPRCRQRPGRSRRPTPGCPDLWRLARSPSSLRRSRRATRCAACSMPCGRSCRARSGVASSPGTRTWACGRRPGDRPGRGSRPSIATASGTPDGYVRYHVDDKWEQRQPRNVLQVDELHALDDEAYADLWRFLIEMDLVATVRAERRSPAERLPWLLTNARAAQMSDSGDGMWLRLLDVPRALAARSYDRTASLVFDVLEDVAGSPTRLLLETSPDGVTCVPTDRSADLACRWRRCPPRTLAAADCATRSSCTARTSTAPVRWPRPTRCSAATTCPGARPASRPLRRPARRARPCCPC